jgi:Spy/CpxP family protein refolding chaperone
MRASRNLTWLLLAFALALASAALAQAPGGPGSRAGGAGNKGLGGPPGRLGDASGPNMVELVTMRLGQLEEDLNLQPNQLALWNAYRDRVMRMLDDHRRALRAASAYTAVDTTAPKRLDALADAARNQLTAIEDIADAGKALYAALTPQQRTLADRRLALPLATLSGSDTGADVLPRGVQRPQGSEPPPSTGARP